MPTGEEADPLVGESSAHALDGRLRPVWLLQSGAERYACRHGLAVPAVDFGEVVACSQVDRRIAAAYAAAPVIDRAAFPAYEAFRLETLRQFEFLTRPAHRGGLGVQVEISRFDPYPSAGAMTRDLRESNRMKVYATSASGNEHPFLTNAENDTFRAVHDAFGHAAIGRGFDADGEEAAWLAHSHMYSPLARRAMTTETRGQQAAFIYTYFGEQFAEQKAALLPPEFSDLRSATIRSVAMD